MIVPETIVCDHGKVFVSRNFQSSCRFLQIEFQPTHKGSPFEEGHIKKMLGSVATMFAQFVAGYTGRSTDHRGHHLERERLWSLLEPATFVYAGINVERLLASVRGEQIAGRFTLIRTHPFPYGPEWKGLVRTLEGTLVLLKHEPLSLIGLNRFLHERCGGMIGSLSHQFRGAAIDAILTGTEELTKYGLEDVPLDLAASLKPCKRTAR